ncbi:hypothetical protein [Lewinella sp. W8]|uniref:hypothetical protein n=1 Tax=Lewinella sp. W8 TaxID=2528208 RepID=UPI0010689290|nr:hypothetical protein [Lewinella sp. W8]MTB53515.1 hypothetical protein [Lewinella sp. W8]
MDRQASSIHLLTHNGDNEVFDRIDLDPSGNHPDFIPIKSPEVSELSVATLAIAKKSAYPLSYEKRLILSTIWDVQRDTIFSFSSNPTQSCCSSTRENPTTISMRIKNLDKLQDIYSPTLSVNLNALATTSVGKSTNFKIPSLEQKTSTVVYLRSKGDKDYRQLVIPPQEPSPYPNEIQFDYKQLPVHEDIYTLKVDSPDEFSLKIYATTNQMESVGIYHSKNGYTVRRKVSIKIPVDMDFTEYSVKLSVRDRQDPDQLYLASTSNSYSDLGDIKFPPTWIIDDLAFPSEEGYRFDFEKKNFNKWKASFKIDGLTAPNFVKTDTDYGGDWVLYGGATKFGNAFFLPALPDDLRESLWGQDGRVIIERPNWIFSRDDGKKITETHQQVWKW